MDYIKKKVSHYKDEQKRINKTACPNLSCWRPVLQACTAALGRHVALSMSVFFRAAACPAATSSLAAPLVQMLRCVPASSHPSVRTAPQKQPCWAHSSKSVAKSKDSSDPRTTCTSMDREKAPLSLEVCEANKLKHSQKHYL